MSTVNYKRIFLGRSSFPLFSNVLTFSSVHHPRVTLLKAFGKGVQTRRQSFNGPRAATNMSFLYHILNSNQTPSSYPNLLLKILFSLFTLMILILLAANKSQVQLMANVFNSEFSPAISRLFLLHFCYANQWHKLVLELKSTLSNGRCLLNTIMENILILSPWNLHQVCSAINIVTQDNADNRNKLVDGFPEKTIYVMLSSMD